MMVYLSRIYLDNTARQVRRELGNCHDLHKTIMHAFPETGSPSARDHFGVLFRTESVNDQLGITRLLVQSNTEPDWQHLYEAGYLGSPPEGQTPITIRSLDADYSRIADGMRCLFRMRANPTKRISDRTPGRDDPLVGKRVDLLREDDQIAWLHRKGRDHGFELLVTDIDPAVTDVQAAKGEKTVGRRQRGDARMTFGGVLFNGRLAITNRDKFLWALSSGIGTGKAFGFGLLSIAEIG